MQRRAPVSPLSAALLLLCTGILLMYGRRIRRFGRARHERLGDTPGSPLLPGWVVEAFYWALQAPGRWIAALGVDPDVVTVLGLLCSVASLPLLATGRLAEGALCVAAGGGFDALDGMVARLRGRASPAGAVLNAVLDRASDSAPLAGLVVLYRGSAALVLVPVAALVASSLVSYARARTDALGLRLPDGLMRRHERVAYLVLALLVAPVAPAATIAPGVEPLPYPILLLGVAFVAVGGFVGAALLVARARAALSRPEPLSPTQLPMAGRPMPPTAPMERAAP